MFRNVLPRLLLLACLSVLLVACAGESFKPCQVSVLNIRPVRGTTAQLLGALLGGPSGESAGPEFVVTLKVANPNDRGIEMRGLSGVVTGPEGELGTFRLPTERAVPLPANGTAVVDVLAAPGPGFLKGALPFLLSRTGRAELKASGHVEVATWLGTRRVEFRDVRLGGG
jgi:LEA14-like dessication related protein